MKSNKWKVSFWICLIVSSILIFYLLNSNLDRATSIMYMKEGYRDTEKDFDIIVKIVNSQNKSINNIANIINDDEIYKYQDSTFEIFQLGRVMLIFEDDTLKRINKMW